MSKIDRVIAAGLILFTAFLCSCGHQTNSVVPNPPDPPAVEGEWSISVHGQTITYPASAAPSSDGAYAVVNGNTPFFTKNQLVTKSSETYGKLDKLGRCTECFAVVGRDLMPTEERGSIGQIKPTGWHTVKYDCVDGKYLYNRCHLIGYQLTAENANSLNLVTGTRFLNIKGMLPFENLAADYIKETNHHVLYRATPVFVGDEMLARGVLLEGQSVEDDNVLFCVFCFNVQPGVEIRYSDGESWLSEQIPDDSGKEPDITYILNTSSKKFHLENCSAVSSISEKNKAVSHSSRTELIYDGYEPCGICKP